MKYILTLVTLMAFTALSYAQPGSERPDRPDRPDREERMKRRGKDRKKMDAKKVAYITERLDLSVEEAQGFWPIYNDFEKKRKEMVDEVRPEKPIDELTDQEARAVMAKVLESKQKGLALEQEYAKRLEYVLPAKKILMLIDSEREFKRSVIKGYKKRMKGKRKQKEKK